MKFRPVFAAATGLVALAACNAANQAQATKVMAATVISTPDIVLRPEFIAGFDASVPTFDAGFAFDAGTFGVTVPAETLALAFFGERQGDGVSQPPAPLPNTGITIEVGSGSSFPMKEEMTGGFSKTSLDDGAFVYAEGEQYTFTARVQGSSYVAQLSKAPPKERIRQFHPPEGFLDLEAGADFVFTRADPPEGEDRDVGFVTVVPLSPTGQRGSPTFTNVPTDFFGLLRLVAGPGGYKKSEFHIPGEAFPEADRNYLILMQTARLGGPLSENLFIGSAILAGTAEVAVVKTHKP